MVEIRDTVVENGHVVELSEVLAAETSLTRGGSLRIIAACTGEPPSYVVLRSHAADGEEVDVPEDAQVLSVEDGTGMSAPSVWLLVPRDAYGGEA